MKIGHLFSTGKSAQNKTVVALKHYFNSSFGFQVVGSTSLEKREKHVHKYQCGNIVVIGGSSGMTGAGLLAALAGLRAGVGLARYFYFSDQLINTEPALMTNKYENAEISEMIKQRSVLVIGPGLRQDDANLVMNDYISRDLVMVIDAGALHALPKNYDFNNQCILTPHIGEAAMLLNQSNEYVMSHPIASAMALYKNFNTSIVLKAASTIIVFNGQVSVVTNGDSNLATAGSGDVLAGMLGGYIASYGLKKHIIEHVVFRHADIGKIWSQTNKQHLIASDLLKGI